MEKVSMNQSKILKCILDAGEITRPEIARQLNLSMPTVLQILKQLIDLGIIYESGVNKSVVGRKAKVITVAEDWCYAVGLDITKNHIGIVLINLRGNVLKFVRKRKTFENTVSYCMEVGSEIRNFIESCEINKEKILGVGVSLPGIVDQEKNLLIRSHILELENYSLINLAQALPYPVYFENDANAALMAEAKKNGESVLYLSLSNTVGGSIQLNGEMFRGNNLRAGEFGHMVIHQNGKLCYCGRKGCLDAYCSAGRLRTKEDMPLEEFMELVKNGDKECCNIWDQYLEDLAFAVINLQIFMDTNIILGGYVGYYLKDYMPQLSQKILDKSIFNSDVSFLRNSMREKEVSAAGAASYFLEKYIREFQV